jgi:large subunit ribosomal protein L29
VTKAVELRELHDEELLSRLSETGQELFNLRFQHVTGQLDNYARLRQVRREVARIETLLREREIAAAEAEEAAEDQRRAEEAAKRRARVEASRRGAVAGVGAEAARDRSAPTGPADAPTNQESHDG